MKLRTLPRKVVSGLPYLAKELRAQVSDHTPLFIAKPRVVHLWRNAPCNGRCIMCNIGYSEGEARQELFKSPLKDEMIPRLLDQISELGGRGTMVSYMGGEPLLSRRLMDWLDQAKVLGLDIRFTTNGYLLDEEAARRLVGANLFNIGVSLESLDPAINEQIRPIRDGTAKTIKAIEWLLQEKRKQRARLSINIKCTLTQLNFESVIGIVERWGKTDGVIVTPQTFEVLNGMPAATKDRLWISDISRLERTIERLKQLKGAGYSVNADERALDSFVRLYRDDPERKSTMNRKTVVDENQPDCNIGTDNLFVIADEVKLCPYFPAIGNVRTDTTTLKQMWYSDIAQKIRSDIKRCRTLCTLSCLRRSSLRHKVKTFLKM